MTTFVICGFIFGILIVFGIIADTIAEKKGKKRFCLGFFS